MPVPSIEKSRMRRFVLKRTEDVSGTSGTGIVAEGCVFSNGMVTMTWFSHLQSMTTFVSMDVVRNIHGHEGRTKVEFIDPE